MNCSINVTERAIKKISYLLSQEDPNTKFRVSVISGGCTGFQYKYDFVKEQDDTDLAINQDGAIILIDEVSKELMSDCIIDYVESLSSAGFEVRNPNATSKCGCGNSFSI